jgi:phosphate transport system protein
METADLSHHISRRFNEDLERVRNKVLTMGGMVEQQLANAVTALIEGDSNLGVSVARDDFKVNGMEMSIDEECSRILATRAPAAGDLRVVVAIIKTITDLERIGDESAKVARAAKWLREKEKSFRVNRIPDIRLSGDAATIMLHKSLDAFARMDAQAAAQLIDEDEGIDERFRAILRQLITFMMEDPRAISASLDTVWAAKAIERIGDHAKNIAEHVIFIAYGADVRHATPEERRRAISGQ